MSDSGTYTRNEADPKNKGTSGWKCSSIKTSNKADHLNQPICYSVLILSSTAIAAVRISSAARGDRGTMAHLKGCGALSRSRFNDLKRIQSSFITYLESLELIAFGSISISTPVSSFALEMFIVDSTEAIIIHSYQTASGGACSPTRQLTHDISGHKSSRTDPTYLQTVND